MFNMDKNKETISFFINEIEEEYKEKEDIDFIQLINQIECTDIYNDNKMSKIIHYSENFTLKELYLICEYYGFVRDLKSNKCNKEVIINILVDYELNPDNLSIVTKRENLWLYINELKNDKFMKKYVLW